MTTTNETSTNVAMQPENDDIVAIHQSTVARSDSRGTTNVTSRSSSSSSIIPNDVNDRSIQRYWRFLGNSSSSSSPLDSSSSSIQNRQQQQYFILFLKRLLDYRTRFVQTIIEPYVLTIAKPFFRNHPVYQNQLEQSSTALYLKTIGNNRGKKRNRNNDKNHLSPDNNLTKGQNLTQQHQRNCQEKYSLGKVRLLDDDEEENDDCSRNHYHRPLHTVSHSDTSLPFSDHNNDTTESYFSIYPTYRKNHTYDYQQPVGDKVLENRPKYIYYDRIVHHDNFHRRLGFLPIYVYNTTTFSSNAETSMSFSALSMLFITLSFIFLIFLSCFYHNQKTSPLFISPRRHRLPKLVPPPLPIDHYMSWIRVCFYLSDEEILNRIGYDSLIFIRFHRLALRCIVKISVFSFIILLPLNYTGGWGHAKAQDLKEYVDSLFFTDFLRFTMANIKSGSPRFWIHCFAAYLLTVIVIRELLIEYEHFNTIRHRYLLSREPHLRTVLVTNIPRHLRSASKVTNYFKHVYPNAVKAVFMCQNVIHLETLVANRTKVLHQIEKELLLLYRNEKKKLIYYEQQQQQNQNHHTIWNKAVSTIDRVEDCCCSSICCCFTNNDNDHDNNSCIPSYCCLYHGTQERLAKLYIKLEELNNDIECEQRRRRRVMKMLDRIDAGEGSKEIDYVLASPFVIDSNNPTHRAILGLNPSTTKKVTKLPSSSTKRHPYSIHEEHDNYEPPRMSTSPPNAIELSDEGIENQIETTQETDHIEYTTEGDISNQLRSRSPPASTSINNDGRTVADKQPQHDGIIKMGSSKKKSRKVSFAKARNAIQRYGRLQQPDLSSNVLTQPIMQQQQLHQENDNMDSSRNHSIFSWFRSKSNNMNGKDGVTTSNARRPIAADAKIEDHINEVTDKAFVVMRTFTAATIAIQSMHSSKPGSMQVSTAPEPRDILWENIYMSKGAFRTRSYLGEFVVLLIIAFYIVPVATIALFVSEQALISSSKKIAQLAQASAFFSAAIALVQPLCVVGLQQLLPPLFMVIGRMEGITSFSEVQMKTFSRYFLFQVVNIFLVTTIAGSIFDAIAIIIETPEMAFEMLGNSLPRMSSFFIAFVTIKTFLGLGFELVRTMALAQATARYILFPNATLRAKRQPLASMRAIDDPGWFPFHKILAQDMLVVVISVVFAVVAPLVTLPCALFCLCSRIMWTHHHLYVYESVFESGGQFWPKIFRRFVFGLIIAQMTITGQFILKEARHQAYATILLMFLTYFFLRSTRARYDPTSSSLPLEVATVMDISLKQDEESVSPGDPTAESGGVAVGNGGRVVSMSPRQQDPCVGTYIGPHDPFRKAYIQPALRANPRARPEQPFPVSQLGRYHHHSSDGLSGNNHLSSNSGESISTEGGGWGQDGKATVRLKSMNQNDRRLINRWWNDQLQRAGPQNNFAILIGEECGTLRLSGPSHLYGDADIDQQQYVDNHPTLTGDRSFV